MRRNLRALSRLGRKSGVGVAEPGFSRTTSRLGRDWRAQHHGLGEPMRETGLLPAQTSLPTPTRMGHSLPRRDIVQISTRFLSPTGPFLPRRDDAPESTRFVPPWEKVWRQGRRTRPSLHNVSAWERRSCVKFQLGRDSPRATSCLGRSSGDKGGDNGVAILVGQQLAWSSNSRGAAIRKALSPRARGAAGPGAWLHRRRPIAAPRAGRSPCVQCSPRASCARRADSACSPMRAAKPYARASSS